MGNVFSDSPEERRHKASPLHFIGLDILRDDHHHQILKFEKWARAGAWHMFMPEVHALIGQMNVFILSPTLNIASLDIVLHSDVATHTFSSCII